MLDWRRRLHIALNAAQGLEYLHTGCSPSIIHRNVKSSNILLTPEFDAKVVGFGLVKFTDNQTRDPRAYSESYTGRVSTKSVKSDVCSFGVVLLELITGKMPYYLSDWVQKNLPDNESDLILAPVLEASNSNMEAVWKVVDVAIQSVKPKGRHRPTMAQVVQELQGAVTLEVGH